MCVCNILEHTVNAEMQLDLCRYTSLCSILTVLFYALIVWHSVCMHDLYISCKRAFLLSSWYADVGLKAMKGIHISHEFSL